MTGSDGMKRMQALMAKFRSDPPTKLGGLAITGVRDYASLHRRLPDGSTEPIEGPNGNVLIFETSEAGNYVAARPSGTEPKIKFYMFTYVAKDDLADLDASKDAMTTRIESFAKDMQEFADTI